jgi:dihydropteroate synthase
MVKLVGILNLTPDSFSDGGQFTTEHAALQRAAQLFNDGASKLDIGAESTRPGAIPLTSAQEWARLEPILPQLMAAHPGQLSLDTYHPETARHALELGSIVINDVTGMTNPKMIGVVAEFGAKCIISHLPTNDIQAAHRGELVSDIVEVVDELLARASILRAEGHEKHEIILDPGIGFGKTPQLNWQLLEFARYVPDYKVMIGYSRKRFLGEGRLELAPNLAAGRVAIAAGAAYLRVHDVAGHQQLLY